MKEQLGPEKKEGHPTIEESTLVKKTFLKDGKSESFRLLGGWPGAKEGELTIFQELPETTSMMEEKLSGYAWGPNFKSKEEAWKFLKEQGYIEESEQELNHLQENDLENARRLRNPDVPLGKEEGIGETQAFKIIQEEFGFDPNGEPIKTEERYGGVEKGGYWDELNPTNQEGIYLKLVFNSKRGLEQRRPSAVSLIRLDLEK